MKNKKWLKKLAALAVGTIMVGTLAFAACDDGAGNGGGGEGGGAHSHVWSTTGTDKGNGKHELTCTGEGTCPDGNKKLENHNTSGANGTCSVCDYDPNAGGDVHSHVWGTTGTDNGDGLTHTVQCNGTGTCDEGGSKSEAHNTDADGACSVCGYDPNEDDGVVLDHTLVKVDDLSGSVTDFTGLDGVSLKAAASSAGSNAYTSAFNGDSLSLTKYVSTGGGIKGNNGIKVETTEATTVYVYAYSGGSGERFLALYDVAEPENNTSDAVDGTVQSIGNGTGTVLGVAKFEIAANETKYIGSTGSSIYIYAIGLVTGGTVKETAVTTEQANPATCVAAGNIAYTVTNYGRYLSGTTAIGPHATVDPQKPHDYEYDQAWLNNNLPTADNGVDITVTCKNDACSHSTETVHLPELGSEFYYKTDAAEGKMNYSYTDKDTNVEFTFVADEVQTKVKEKQSYSIEAGEFDDSTNSQITTGDLFTMTAVSSLTAAAHTDTNNSGWSNDKGDKIANKGDVVLVSNTVIKSGGTVSVDLFTIENTFGKTIEITIEFIGFRCDDSGTLNFGNVRDSSLTATYSDGTTDPVNSGKTGTNSRTGKQFTFEIPANGTVTIKAVAESTNALRMFICGVSAVEK